MLPPLPPPPPSLPTLPPSLAHHSHKMSVSPKKRQTRSCTAHFKHLLPTITVAEKVCQTPRKKPYCAQPSPRYQTVPQDHHATPNTGCFIHQECPRNHAGKLKKRVIHCAEAPPHRPTAAALPPPPAQHMPATRPTAQAAQPPIMLPLLPHHAAYIDSQYQQQYTMLKVSHAVFSLAPLQAAAG